MARCRRSLLSFSWRTRKDTKDSLNKLELRREELTWVFLKAPLISPDAYRDQVNTDQQTCRADLRGVQGVLAVGHLRGERRSEEEQEEGRGAGPLQSTLQLSS